MKQLLILILIAFVAAPSAFAKSKKRHRSTKRSKTINMERQFDRLGTNEDIIDKAQALQPNNKMRIVQKREVDRTWRTELGLNYGFVNGGDSYLESRNWGASLDLHINPRWSLGVRYIDNKHALTSEGERVYNDSLAKYQAGNPNYEFPAVDFPETTLMGVINWYPIYGKVSWFESSVSQFDFYLLAGGGQINLASGSSTILTGGAGMGIWWNSWITSRLEVAYQNYKDRVYTGERTVNAVVLQFGLGLML